MNPAPQPAWVLLAGGALGAQRTLATSVRAIDTELLVARPLAPAKGQLFTLRTNIEVSQLVVNEPVGGKYSVLLRLGRLRNGHGVFPDRKSTRLNSSHLVISYAVFCLKKKKTRSEL